MIVYDIVNSDYWLEFIKALLKAGLSEKKVLSRLKEELKECNEETPIPNANKVFKEILKESRKLIRRCSS